MSSRRSPPPIAPHVETASRPAGPLVGLGLAAAPRRTGRRRACARGHARRQPGRRRGCSTGSMATSGGRWRSASGSTSRSRSQRGAEAALGLDWQAAAGLPLHLLAERRQDLGGAGRSAFAIGAERRDEPKAAAPPPARRLRPGRPRRPARARSLRGRRGAARSAASVRFELGAALWGAAQPGASRLDLGPDLSVRLPVAHLRLSADWRFRIAGDAAPGSGPALTLGADF